MAAWSATADDLIDRFAAAETVWASAISPDGKHVAIGCTQQGVRAACVYELDKVGTPPVVVRVPQDQALNQIAWLDSDWLLLELNRYLYVGSRKVWGRADSVMASNLRTGRSRLLNLMNLSDVVARPAPGELMTSPGRAVIRVDLATGEEKRHLSIDPLVTSAWFNALGQPMLELRTDRSQKHLFAMRGKDGVLVPLEVGEIPRHRTLLGPFAGGIIEGGNKLAMLGYFEGDALRYWEFDTQTGKRLPQDPRLPAGDFAGWLNSFPDQLVGVSHISDVPRQIFFEEALEKLRLSVAKALSGQAIEILSWTDDRSAATLTAAAPGASETHYLFDRKQGSLSPLGAARPQLAHLPASTTTAIEYAARDGLKIEAFLTLPAGKRAADGPFPLLVMPRQEVMGRDDMRFNWLVEFFALRGYAVLRPNFRGSTGYGRAFIERGFGELGGAMIEDIIDGTRFLVGSGLADRNRICAVGIGYGGYASLMIGLREPGLVRCAVAVNAISDPVAMFGQTIKYTDAYSEHLQYWEAYLGERYVDKATAAAISPARRAQSIVVPVLLLHETRGSFVPASQSRYLQEQMELYGRPVQLREYEASDPYFLQTTTRRLLLTESEAFLSKHLGTRPAAE